MTSSLSWLDFSEADEKRSREIIQLFSMHESRDELGIGVVRDILSDALFPGISVLHTRARYLLFIPWIFIVGSRSKSGKELLNYVDNAERQLIKQLLNGGDTEGLIGKDVGVALKVLPSTMYWNGLKRLGILQLAGSKSYVAARGRYQHLNDDSATELVGETSSIWQHNIPPPPAVFPKQEVLDFKLSAGEAAWLSERLMDACPDSLLGWMSEKNFVPTETSFPWEEAGFKELTESLSEIVNFAKHFSMVVQGAALLYNYLLAKRSEEIGFELGESSDVFRKEYGLWCDEFDSAGTSTEWDIKKFWNLIESRSAGSRIPRDFIDEWFGICCSKELRKAIDDVDAQTLIRQREQQMKSSKARLSNDKQLRQWGGRSGTRRLSFRWDEVKVLMRDIGEGLGRA